MKKKNSQRAAEGQKMFTVSSSIREIIQSIETNTPLNKKPVEVVVGKKPASNPA